MSIMDLKLLIKMTVFSLYHIYPYKPQGRCIFYKGGLLLQIKKNQLSSGNGR